MRADRFVLLACRVLAVIGVPTLVVGCSTAVRLPAATQTSTHDDLADAKWLAQQATATHSPKWAARTWSHCAALAYRAAGASDGVRACEAAALNTTCTRGLLDLLLTIEPPRWASTTLDLAGSSLVVDVRGMPSSLAGPMRLVRADTVGLPRQMGPRFAVAGLGVALVATTPRCSDRPICQLYPIEGVFRPATAWVEADKKGQPRLVITDPATHPDIVIGSRVYPLTIDTSAPSAMLVKRSRLSRLAVWNLLGGKQIGMRQGLYLLQDYDPDKIPIVMIHGLGASPLIWERLTNRILGSADLRSRYQVWQVIYQTNAPMLIARLRVQQSLDKAWSLVDPRGQDRARHDTVLVGHSMGGVIARLLTANSGTVLWDAASTVPPGRVHASAGDLQLLDSVLHFAPYPGVGKAIFLAAPHLGSPLVEHFIGRLALRLVTPRASELDVFRRYVKANPSTVPRGLLLEYMHKGLSSISTLSTTQPVSRASQALMPAAGIRYFTVAGSLPGAKVPGDGVVPLASAILGGAESTTIVNSAHDVYDNDEAIAQVIRILREP